MECVRKEDEHDENEDPADNNCQFTSDIVNKKCDSIAAMTASERLNATCFRMVNENSCSQVNCEYSNDKAVIAAAREKQMTDLTATKRGDGRQSLQAPRNLIITNTRLLNRDNRNTTWMIILWKPTLSEGR